MSPTDNISTLRAGEVVVDVVDEAEVGEAVARAGGRRWTRSSSRDDSHLHLYQYAYFGIYFAAVQSIGAAPTLDLERTRSSVVNSTVWIPTGQEINTWTRGS